MWTILWCFYGLMIVFVYFPSCFVSSIFIIKLEVFDWTHRTVELWHHHINIKNLNNRVNSFLLPAKTFLVSSWLSRLRSSPSRYQLHLTSEWLVSSDFSVWVQYTFEQATVGTERVSWERKKKENHWKQRQCLLLYYAERHPEDNNEYSMKQMNPFFIIMQRVE